LVKASVVNARLEKRRLITGVDCRWASFSLKFDQ
jgi:hypothetical protein